jgi:hypothetical protein
VTVEIERVTEADLADLLPLMRGYCEFSSPSRAPSSTIRSGKASN